MLLGEEGLLLDLAPVELPVDPAVAGPPVDPAVAAGAVAGPPTEMRPAGQGWALRSAGLPSLPLSPPASCASTCLGLLYVVAY